MDGVVDDPFTPQPRVPHPLLAEVHASSFDIYEKLFDDFFASDEFRYWSTGKKNWQLHCYGGPGCGKTTLASLVTQRLREMYHEASCPTVSIYILSDVLTDDLSLVEDFLVRTYAQFHHGSIGATDGAALLFEQYVQSRREGQSRAYRIRLLQSIIKSKLCSVGHAFLVLDGYDRLSKGLQIILGQILDQFQPKLCIFITRRTPQMTRSLATECDICHIQGKKTRYLSLYWECEKCWEPNESFALCYDCKNRGEKCTKCNNNLSFIEPYDHINRKLRIPSDQMLSFVQWDSVEIKNRKDASSELCGRVTEQAEGNITVAKLRLDELFAKPGSLAGSRDKIADRLPRSLVAFFDAGINSIMELQEEFGNMTLASIIFAAEDIDIDIAALGEKLQARGAAISVSAMFGSLEDLLLAANGFLTMPNENSVSCFHSDFRLYVAEDYNQGLFDLKTRLQSLDDATKLTRANISVDSLVESPPQTGHSFDIVSDSMIPPSRHISYKQNIPSGLGLVEVSRWTDSFEKMKLSPPRMNSDQQLPLFSKDAIMKTVPQTTRICQFCLTKVLEGDTSGTHQTSTDQISKSINDSCIFCSSLYDERCTLRETGQPIYAWKIRDYGRQNLKITFTYLGSPQKSRAFYMIQGGELGITSNFDGSSTDPYVSGGGQIQRWIENCDVNHHGCRKATMTDYIPTRLLQLQSNNRDLVKLVITKEHDIKEPYCTLSHSWGPPTVPFITTTNENLQTFQQDGFETNELPKNFRHAIEVARFMKLKYIWIDSLCIIQKDGGEDFKREGDQMHRVYQNSYCNIVAADSADSRGGLFRAREAKDVMPAKYEGTSIFGHQSWDIIPDDLWDAQLLGTRIYTRGWVFQERMLSPRLLHFTNKQIFWDCGTISACETYPSGLPLPVDSTAATDRHWRGRLQQRSRDKKSLVVGANDDSIESFWQTAVSKYTSCDLTKQMDKTVAIWSIAKTVRDITGEAYACGLWGFRLEEQLAWRISDGGKGLRVAELQWRFPSWSWVSVMGPISAANRIVERMYAVTDHEGKAIAFPSPVTLDNDPGISEEDIEPRYSMPAAIPICGIVQKGVIRLSEKDSYYLFPLWSKETSLTVLESPFVAFQDEPPDAQITTDTPCIFVLLAATSYQPENSFLFQQPLTDVRRGMMYSGVGILLQEPSTAITRYQEDIPRLQQEMDLITLPEEQWKKSNYEEEIRYTRNLLERLSHQADECASGKQCYRRIGAIYFEGVAEDDWEKLTGEKKTFFWLI